jgi:hypothetical protein
MPTRSALNFNLGKQIADLVLAAHLSSCNILKRIEAWRAMRRSSAEQRLRILAA